MKKKKKKPAGARNFCMCANPPQVGRTEHIKDNLSPSFTRAVEVDYFFEEVQHLQFVLYDVDSLSSDLRTGGGELLGTAKTQLGKVSLSACVYSMVP